MAAVTAAFLVANPFAKAPIASNETATVVAEQRIGGFVLHDRPRPVPDLRFIDVDSRENRLSDFRGKVVLLNIWATWCTPCRREMPQLDRLQARLGGPDFEIVPLSIDRGGLFAVKAFFDELDLRHLRIFLDQSGTASRELGVIGLPTTLLVDREGRELGRLMGPTEWEGHDIDRLIRSAIAGRVTGATDRTRPRAEFAPAHDDPRPPLASAPPT